MSLVDPQRHREALVRLASLTPDGLEELTLRLVRTEYPAAHRTGPGRDGGVDVLSDLEVPPARGWQAKNLGDRVPWTQCAESLEAAMTGPAPPKHYTFVFPRPLKASERDRWRDDFLPAQTALYPQLEKLDYIDDLGRQLESRPDLVDLLDNGNLSGYIRETLELTTQEGVNPLASAVDLAADAQALAKRSKAVGKRDPHFAYGEMGREANAGDAALPDRVMHFSLTNVGSGGRPRFAMTVRDGDEVTELTAEPRANAIIDGPEPWFAPGDEGDALRARARASLAKGVPISLDGPSVGLRPGTVPDRFRALVDEDGLLRGGGLELGLSKPLTLAVSVTGQTISGAESITLYRVPALPGDSLAYAGSFGGAIVSLDLREGEDRLDQSPDAFDVELVVGMTLALDGEPARAALAGLGFARAFATAHRVELSCEGLLPPEGVSWEGASPPEAAADAIWQRAAFVAQALRELNARDGGDRRMPEAVTVRDVAVAQMVNELALHGEVRTPLNGEFDVPLPEEPAEEVDVHELMIVEAPLPPLLGEPTHLRVVQTVEGATPLGLVDGPADRKRLRCRADDGAEAALVMRLA